MNYIINLVLGDWSNDGHGRTTTFNIFTNLSKDEIDQAYKLGTNHLGIDFCDEICDHDSTILPIEVYDKLRKNGYTGKFKLYKGEIYPDIDDFVDIYLFLVKLGNPKFKYMNISDNPLYIGGLGFFNEY